MLDYKVNDRVWFVPDGYLIAIECIIRGIDDYFRKKESQSYLFYDLDEPVGHNVSVTELYKTKDLALEELKQRHKELLEEDFHKDLLMTLEKYRKGRINFIVSTWENYQDHEQSFIKKSWYLKLPVKEYGKEWFNINNM